MLDFDAILKDNRARLAMLTEEYDPIIGFNSPIERQSVEYVVNGNTFQCYFPKSMINFNIVENLILEPDLNKQFAIFPQQQIPFLIEQCLRDLNKERFKHDFEFWAVLSVKIKDKKTGKNIPFKLNRAQRRLLKELEADRISGNPIRIILLKARQWGGSTLTQVYAGWIQNIHKIEDKWNSVIVADVEGQTRNIRSMYRNLSKHYPTEIGSITFAPFEGSNKNIMIVENESVISIGSMQKPESLRSDDIKLVHFSEVGLWKATKSKSPEDVIQTVKSSVLRLPYTMIVEESTAKGVGNYFHVAWQRAESGESGYTPVFIPWYLIEMYQKPILRKKVEFIQNMSEYDMFMWELGATLEGINWYNDFLQSELKGDTWRMRSEFPSTAEEAFQSTGRPVFHPIHLFNLTIHTEVASTLGILEGKSDKGIKAFEDIRFLELHNGWLTVWNEPVPYSKEPIKDRYVVSLDIGGAHREADKSIITVYDRLWLLDGDGELEVVASGEFNLDQDLTVWRAIQVAKWYNGALFVPEFNSLDSEADTEGNHFYTILDEIVDDYPNIYMRTTVDQIRLGKPAKYGFHTNRETKPMIIDNYKAMLRENKIIERSKVAIAQLKSFEHKENGKTGGAGKMNDDYVMSRMIGAWIATKYMDLPKRMEMGGAEAAAKRIKKHGIVGEASI